MTKCPNCFTPISPVDFAWVCETPTCPGRGNDPIASRYWASPVVNGPVYTAANVDPALLEERGLPPAPECKHCRRTTVEACPTCHSPLPRNWRGAEVTCIAMNGARATGKSVYVAVVVKELRALAARMRTSFVFGDDRTRDIYGDVYERPLFEERGLMPPTPSASTNASYQRAPLLFAFGNVDGRPHHIVLRDVAGEDMERATVDAGHLRFLRNADAILFMFDPLAVPNVRHRLIDLVPAQLQLGGDPTAVLENLMRVLGDDRPPIGVILSKFDAVQALARVDDVQLSRIMSNAGSAVLRDPSEERVEYDDADGALLHEEVRSILELVGGESVVLGVQNPYGGGHIQHRFFAVSALGESPDGKRLHARGIAPFRTIDPVKWVLARRGVIPHVG